MNGEQEKLLLEHLPIVRFLARRIHERLPQQVDIEDLVSAGLVGLAAALWPRAAVAAGTACNRRLARVAVAAVERERASAHPCLLREIAHCQMALWVVSDELLDFLYR